MKRTPYPHQKKVIDDMRFEFLQGARSVLIQACPRFGKTVVSSSVISGSQVKQKRVIFCVHRENLIYQTANTFADDDIDFSYIKSGMPYDSTKLVHIASVQTLVLRLDEIAVPDILFVDECHLAKADTYDRVIRYFIERGTLVIGLTGTPWRLDGRPLSTLFEKMVCGPSVRWLIDNGFLSDFRYFAPPEKPNGALIGDAVEHYKKYASGLLAVAYCRDVKHSKETCEQFNKAGVRAAHIDGSMKKHELKAIYQALGNREIDVLCSVELVKEGFDLSAQVGKDITIECVILLRKTHSLALFLQMSMRCLTKKPTTAVILDHGGNVLLHGMPDDAFEWSLEGKALTDKGGSKEGVLPPVICEDCFNAIKRPLPESCPYCEAELKKQAAVIKIIEGELMEIKEAERKALKEKQRQEERDAKTLNDFIALGQQRGYKNAGQWARKKVMGRAVRERRYLHM